MEETRFTVPVFTSVDTKPGHIRRGNHQRVFIQKVRKQFDLSTHGND